jgi:hypothetical protein
MVLSRKLTKVSFYLPHREKKEQEGGKEGVDSWLYTCGSRGSRKLCVEVELVFAR